MNGGMGSDGHGYQPYMATPTSSTMSGAPGTVRGLQSREGEAVVTHPDSGVGSAFQRSMDWRLIDADDPALRRCFLEIDASPRAVPCARQYATNTLKAWELIQIADDAELIVSELVTNAIKATTETPPDQHVVLILAADEKRLFVLVWDGSSGEPVRSAQSDDATSGRGLEIIDMVSEDWGVTLSDTNGKVVWAILTW